MRIDYTALDARARGLAARLCTREELERWAGLPDPPTLGRALETSGRLATALPAVADAADIDEAECRTIGTYLATLARWAGPANPVLDAFYADQDRRSLRSLVRGATQGAPSEARLAGLMPTPRLPLRLLAELAQARSAREIATRLFVLRDPHAEALVALTAQARVDLLEVEFVLARAWAGRLRDADARADPALRERICARIDLVNAQAALELVDSASDFPAPSLFIAGGRVLDCDTFVAAATAASRESAAALLARAFAGTPLARPFTRASADSAQFQGDALADTIDALRTRSRIEPLGSAPVQLFLARLDAQSTDVRRLAWGLELGVPSGALREALVTPWT